MRTAPGKNVRPSVKNKLKQKGLGADWSGTATVEGRIDVPSSIPNTAKKEKELASEYSRSSVSLCDGFQDFCRYQNPHLLRSLYGKV
jgi:hypothetical protein